MPLIWLFVLLTSTSVPWPPISSECLLYCDKESAKVALTLDCVSEPAYYCLSMYSCSLSSLNHGCLSVWLAVIRLSGLYTRSFTIKSYTSLLACGISFSIPVPSTAGKLNSIWVAYFWKLSRRALSGDPNMLWILCTWSTSSFPGNRGNSEMTSKRTHPTPQRSILYP